MSTLFWQVICVHTNLIRLETVKENVYLDKFRNDATMTFCLKISFFLFMKVIPMLFLKRCYSFMLLNLSNWHTVVLIQSTKECVSSWLTNVHSRRLNKCTFSVSLNSPFMLLVFLHQKHRWKVPERKTALQRINCNNVRAKKISLENFSSVVSVKWVNNRTQAQLNRRRPRHSSNTMERKEQSIYTSY